MLQVLLIESDDTSKLYPFTELHCTWELRFGYYTVYERWLKTLTENTVTFSSHRDIHVRGFVERVPESAPFQVLPTLLILGNVVISPSEMRRLSELCKKSDKPLLFTLNSRPIGAYSPKPLSTPWDSLTVFETETVGPPQIVEVHGTLVDRIWQTLGLVAEAVGWDAELLGKNIDASASVHPTVVIDETDGQVIVGENSVVHPFAVLIGPLSIGAGSTVFEHSKISKTVIGPVCKVAGEISASIFFGYSNKAHDGYIGYSILGEWCNLGAGTVSSDLKNTYGNIVVQMPEGAVPTGLQFLGTCFGDYCRTGIGTLLSTGSVLGVNVSIAVVASVNKSVTSFSWIDSNGIVRYDLEKAIEHNRTMMGRRNVKLGEHAEALLREVSEHANA
ncbi:MAG: hypothetical protein HQ472_00180 [Ignavibacteria bacterium]|nr:hypothetical protein [Ignavibacteria bacterium]